MNYPTPTPVKFFIVLSIVILQAAMVMKAETINQLGFVVLLQIATVLYIKSDFHNE